MYATKSHTHCREESVDVVEGLGVFIQFIFNLTGVTKAYNQV